MGCCFLWLRVPVFLKVVFFFFWVGGGFSSAGAFEKEKGKG